MMAGRKGIGWAVLAAVVLVAATPPLRARAKAGPTFADAAGLASVRPLSAAIEMREEVVDGVAGHRYSPGWSAPAVLLVPGATRAGLGDGRVERAARALAGAGRSVFVPDLELYQRRFSRSDIDRLVRATRGLAARSGRPVSILGFSYGGSLALVAAAEPGMAEVVEQVAVFGAYHSLVGVLQAATTGVSLVDGERLPWPGDPQAREILLEVIADLAPAGQSRAVREAVRGERDPQDLGPEARALHDVVVNTDPRRTGALVGLLPQEIQDLLRRFSPASVAERIAVPVVALHSRDDPAVPYAEGLRLAADLPDIRLVSVDLFTHVDVAARRGSLHWVVAVPDLWRAWRYAGWILASQEPLVPPLLRRVR
jgi:pimeloyl-ACP methyl ester carboxylesterase